LNFIAAAEAVVSVVVRVRRRRVDGGRLGQQGNVVQADLDGAAGVICGKRSRSKSV
jgi:hypothetical protein